MKDSLFEMLLTLFEKTLAQLKETHVSDSELAADHQSTDNHESSLLSNKSDLQAMFVKVAQPNSTRIFTYAEQMKFTKASYQFLMRMSTWGILAANDLETIINQLTFSDSRFISLQETKWVIRNVLAENLDAEQLAFLDLVLYQREDELPLH